MSDTSGAASSPFIFWAPGTDPTGQGLSYEQLKQRRAIAAALASRSRPYPTTIGQGIASLGESFGDAMYERATQQAEKAQSDLDRRAREEAGGATATPPPPAASPSGRRAEADTPNPAYASMADSILAQQGALTPPPSSQEPPAAVAPQPTVAGGPMMTRMAALNTGTVSDAGSPGATYGGPSPTGPGASLAEPPDRAPPAPSVPPPAAAAASPYGPVGTPSPGGAGGGQVPRAALAGPIMAQAGTRPPVSAPRPTAPAVSTPAPIQAAPGTLTQPPVGGPVLPDTMPAPGQAPMNPPTAAGTRPPKPAIGVDTPEMANIKRVLSDPQYRNMSPPQREQLIQSYQRLKETRDKNDAENLTEWNRLDADYLARKKIEEEQIRTGPKERLDLSDAQGKENIRRRFNTKENYEQVLKNTGESADKAKTLADSLHNLYKAQQILLNKGMVAGVGAQSSPFSVNVMGSNIGLPSNMTWQQMFGNIGFENSKQAVINTQEFRALMRPMVKAMLQQTTGAGSVSNAEVEQAMEGLGIAGNLEKEAMIKIIDNLRENAYRAIKDHNAKMDATWNVPAQDASIHKQYRVDLPRDPHDVMMLKATPNSSYERSLFDQKYGQGAAARELGFGR